MSEILDFYQQQANAARLPVAWLAELQTKALNEFKRCGFPGRHQEDWKYTTVDPFLQHHFATAASGYAGGQIKTDLPFEQEVVIANGEIMPGAQQLANLPAGVIVKPLIQAAVEHEELLKPYLNQLLTQEHGFHALNLAALRTGIFIYLPENACVDDPIVLAHWQDKEDQAVYARHVIIAETGSKATIIESYQGAPACRYFTNTVTEVHTAPDAKIIHYKIQRESKAAFHIGHLAVKQDSASQFDSHSLSLGGRLVRSDASFRLQGGKAQCLLNGVYMPANGQHVDHHTTVYHEVANCQSTQDYKGILNGSSKAVFNGKVVVARDAQKTQAAQQNKNLLLSAKAEIDTKPQLEIYADDVVCSHGATVGQLDEDALFYLATRGIGRHEASQFLVSAFAADNLRLVPDAYMAGWMADLINQQLEG
ncbi:Fe-S cluster assembly protein SufD [Legionella dresdenensis]|uniref:Fe-S cluster assembly protein SufD n=1 Tax=Legionella dresdenensis TaxID=450200 RepID=A0ABV8CH34_9GAMM